MWISNLYIVVYTEWGSSSLCTCYIQSHSVKISRFHHRQKHGTTQPFLTPFKRKNVGPTRGQQEVPVYTNRPVHRYMSASWCVKQSCAWRTDFLLLQILAACTHFQQHGRTGCPSAQKHVAVQLNRLLCWSRVELDIQVIWSVPTLCTAALQSLCWLNVFGIRIRW